MAGDSLIKKKNGYTSPRSVMRERWRREAAEAEEKEAEEKKPKVRTRKERREQPPEPSTEKRTEDGGGTE